MPCTAKTGMNHRRPANCDRQTSTLTSITLAKKAMTVPHLQDSTENELPEGNHTENERIKLVTPCGNQVVAIEARAGAEKHEALACNILMAAKQHLEKLEESKVIVLIIGTSQSERIAVEIASKIPAYSKDQVNIFIADSSIERLMAAQKVCSDVIHWPVDEDEPSLVEKTKSTCKGGADLICDFVGTPRTIKRAIQLLNKDGALLIGSDTFTKSSTSLHTLIAQQEVASCNVLRSIRSLTFEERATLTGFNSVANGKEQVFDVHKNKSIKQEELSELTNGSCQGERQILRVVEHIRMNSREKNDVYRKLKFRGLSEFDLNHPDHSQPL